MTGRRGDNAIRGLVIVFSPYLLIGLAILVFLAVT